MVVVILKVFVFLIGFHLFLGIENGVVLPNDPYVYIGNNLTLHCNLTKYVYDSQYQSSKLMFLRKYDEVVPRKYITITSTRSIMLRYPLTSPEDGGNYECKLNGSEHQRPVSIGSQHVHVEYEPQPITEIDCRVYNWENMTCTWDLGVEFVHPNTIEINLVWAISSYQFECPHLTQTSCSWLFADGLDSFTPDKDYLMGVTIKNNATKPEPTFYPERPKVIRIETSKIVEPAPVVKLQAKKNSTCIEVSWSHKRLVRDKVYRIRFKAKHEKKWQTKHVGDEETWTECSFRPYTEYQFNVSCKPRLYTMKVQGFWSKDTSISVLTDEDVPSKSPVIGPGSYIEMPCLQYCKKVTLYWKPLTQAETNGNITYYKIDYRNLANNVTKHETSSQLEHLLMLAADNSYVIQLRAATGKGLSEKFSQINLPTKSQKPSIPNHIVELHNASGNSMSDISWEVPTEWTCEHWRNLTSFTVYWCQGFILEKHCKTPIGSAEVPITQTKFNLKIDRFETYMFGVAVNADTWKGVRISSGFQWNTCTFVKNAKPEIAPANVHLSAYQPNRGLRLEWDKITCHDTKAFIQHYEINICKAVNSENCTGGKTSLIAKQSATTFDIPNLIKGGKYKIWMSAVSEGGIGPSSEALYASVIDRRLNTGEIMGIVVGGLFIMIIFFLGIIICCRRIVRTVKQKYFEPIPIIMPNTLPPLPPIPMPQRQLSSDSYSSDGIYEKIDGPPSPCSSAESTTGVEAPLISSKWNILTLKDKFYKKSKHKLHNDSGRSSLSHSADTLLMRLHPSHIKSSKPTWDDKSGSDSGIIADGRGKVYEYTCTQSEMGDSLYHDHGVPSDNKPYNEKNIVNPYGCVNIVEKIDALSEQLKRKENQMCVIKNDNCDSQRGSTRSLPVQSIKNFSYLNRPLQSRARSSGLRLDLNDKHLMMERCESGDIDSNDGTIDSLDDCQHEMNMPVNQSSTLNISDMSDQQLNSYLQFMNRDKLMLGKLTNDVHFSSDNLLCNCKSIPVTNGYVTEEMMQSYDKNNCKCNGVSDQKLRTLNELRRKFPHEFDSDFQGMEHNLPAHFFNSLSRNQPDPSRTTEL